MEGAIACDGLRLPGVSSKNWGDRTDNTKNLTLVLRDFQCYRLPHQGERHRRGEGCVSREGSDAYGGLRLRTLVISA